MRTVMTPRVKRLFLKSFTAVLLTSCGLSLGGVVVVNDAEPTGNVSVVFSGQIQTQNSAAHPEITVSGTAEIYRDFDNGIHWVRIENLNAPNESGMIVVVEAGGATVLNTGLKGTRGNLTYSTTIPSSDTRVWSSLTIRSTTFVDPTTRDYGKAILQ